MTVVLVGERANRPARRPRFTRRGWLRVMAREGAFLDRLSRDKLASVGVDVGSVAAVNLLPPAPAGEPWDPEWARWSASRVAAMAGPSGLLVVAGARVRAALGLRGSVRAAAGRVEELAGGARALTVPHPSGLNHWWNDPALAEALRPVVERVLRGETTCR